jgi:hypothetical protein
MCRVETIEVTSLPFRFFRDECPCLPAPVEYVEFRVDEANTYCVSIARARRNPAQWPAIAAAYAEWARPVLRLTDQRKTRVRVRAGALALEPAYDPTGR